MQDVKMMPLLPEQLTIALYQRIIKPQTSISKENRDMITALLLEEAGHHVTLLKDGEVNLAGDGVVWIGGNANWFPKLCRHLSAISKHKRPLVVIWHYEPLPPPRAAGLPWPPLHMREIAKILLRDTRASDIYSNYFRLKRLAKKGLPDVLAVSTPERQMFLTERSIKAHFVPLGYDPVYGRDLGLKRDIDIVFLGELRIPRRKKLINRLHRSGVNLKAMGSWSDPAFFGENRTRLLNRTKIFLVIQRYPGELSGSRLILGLANKALPISEPVYNSGPYVPGKHYISATIEEMPGVINYYLTHDDEREHIVNEGYRLVTQEITMKRSVSRILELIGRCMK